MSKVDRLRVAVIGGDQRELILVQALQEEGFDVVVVGYPQMRELARVTFAPSVVEAVKGAVAVVAPMSNTDEHGVVLSHLDPSVRLVLDDEAFQAMEDGTTLFIGVAKPIIERRAARYRVRLVQMAELDEIAILNSIPTAEGAIARAMAELPVTLHGTSVIVIGYGRCGITLARMLAGIGARVRVVARSKAQLARAFEAGLAIGELADLKTYLPEARVVFNSVPTRVLGRDNLLRMHRDTLIIDIASAPGGTDFDVAKELGIKAFLDLGIPGKVAPDTAGQILARTVPDLIRAAYEERV